MYTVNHSNLSFKGFDNIFAARHVDGNSGEYVISMRLNNQGEKDLEQFAPIVNNTSIHDILTIHYAKVEEGKFPNCLKGGSFISVNDFPLLINKSELNGVNSEVTKGIEKISIPLAQNVVNLLKRVAQTTSTLRDSSLATYAAMENTINSICGRFVILPGFKGKATQLVMNDIYKNGEINVIHDVAKTTINGLTHDIMKYFK